MNAHADAAAASSVLQPFERCVSSTFRRGDSAALVAAAFCLCATYVALKRRLGVQELFLHYAGCSGQGILLAEYLDCACSGVLCGSHSVPIRRHRDAAVAGVL